MALTEPRGGLRRVWHNSVQPLKVNLVIAPGDELEVSEDIATQLRAATSHIEDGAAPDPLPTGITGLVEEVAAAEVGTAAASAAALVGESGEERIAAKPAKRATKKA